MKLLARFPRPEPAAADRWAARLLLLAAGLLVLGSVLAPGATGAVSDPAELAHRVDLNRAPWYELTNLPGVGEARARDIVLDRAGNGPYLTVDDLARVRGIGPVTVSRIREYVAGGPR